MVMTEEEWLACAEPQKMLDFLRDKVSERKLRLFACACCRRIWQLLQGHNRIAVEVAEEFAEGQVTEAKRAEAEGPIDAAASAADAAAYSAISLEGRPAWGASHAARQAVAAAALNSDWGSAEEAPASERQAHVSFLRCICGSTPFRPVTVSPAWQTANVVALALAIYDERAFDRMPILADALEDAGCSDHEILAHCRGPGPHVRGCWVVDLLLGKE